jgi:hypothetical protein
MSNTKLNNVKLVGWVEPFAKSITSPRDLADDETEAAFRRRFDQ